MRKTSSDKRKWIIVLLAFTLIVNLLFVQNSNASANEAEPTEAVDTDFADAEASDDTSELGRRETYDTYIAQYEDEARPEASYSLGADNSSRMEDARRFESIEDYFESVGIEASEYRPGMYRPVLKTDETGFVEWVLDVEEAGLYQMNLNYYPIEGRGASIERALTINGELPFFNAGHFIFPRVWTDSGPVRQDNRGNDLRPSQVEAPQWESRWLIDYMGYYLEPYLFYLNEGENIIRLSSVREPMLIADLTVSQYDAAQPYETVRAAYDAHGHREYDGEPLIFQAEDAETKSDATLYAINDRSSPMTEPYDVSKIRLNAIGGYRWNQPGQWISWTVDVPADGLYKLALKSRQNVSRGVYSGRQLTVNGQVPFAEAENLRFYYSTDWEMHVLGQGSSRDTNPNEVVPQLIFLQEGENEIRLEVILGEFAEVIRTIEDSLFVLNEAYRNIIMLTTTNPDIYRDYNLGREMPGVIRALGEQGTIIQETGDRLIEITGERGSQSAILYTLAYQLSEMSRNPDDIPRMLSDFKTNIGALGTWILQATEKPLEIDYIMLSAKDEELPRTRAGFFRNLMHEVRSFLASFTEDYSSVGNIYEGSEDAEPLTIWIQSGRDQSQVLKQLIDDAFTVEYGIPVNLQIVQVGTLLPAVVAGIGPDVALYLGGGEPVNFASRNAAVDLTTFSDFEEVAAAFSPSALVPYEFEGGVFALPETQTFPVMFYRTDILEELGLTVPDTWDEMMQILPVIQKSNLEFGIPVSTTAAPEIGMMSFWMFLYQLDGQVYSHEGAKSALDEEAAIQAFNTWTSLFLNYKLPMEYDFANRFRIGEMPIGIADYQTYNTLSVFAPEIRGLWSMVPVPGLEREDGTIDRAVGGWGQNSMMLEDSDKQDEAWTFMKWWTSAEMQEAFGREMESLLGAAARYPTANLEAMAKLPWPVDDFNSLTEQWAYVQGTPEVPGGYYTSRHLNNAFRSVVYNGDDPRETILDYVRDIDGELTAKRNEFGLPTYEDMMAGGDRLSGGAGNE